MGAMSEIEVEQRQEASDDPFINVRVRNPRREEARWVKVVKGISHGVGAAILLAAGTIWTIRMQHPVFIRPAQVFNLPPAIITAQAPWMDAYVGQPADARTRAEILKVSHFFRGYTKDTAHANRIAAAIVHESAKRNMNPALLAGIVMTEDAKLDPRATSFVGASGLMQVMPFHKGKHGCGSDDLFNVEANICYGASILQQMVKRSPSMERALLRYNGCVRGTNTPNCHTYSGKVLRYAEQAATKMLSFSVGN